MYPRFFKAGGAGLVAAFALPLSAVGNPNGLFSVSELATLKSGGQVFRSQDNPGSPWPKTQVWQLAKGTPQKALWIFTQYNTHTQYFPDVVVSRTEGPCKNDGTEVFYELKVPIIRNEQYRVCNRVEPMANGWRVVWEKTWALRSTQIQGFASFVEWAPDRVLIGHENAVNPGNSFAYVLRNIAIGKAQETVKKLAKRIEETLSHPPIDTPQAADDLAHNTNDLPPATAPSAQNQPPVSPP